MIIKNYMFCILLLAILCVINVSAEEEISVNAKMELQMQHADEYIADLEHTEAGVKRTERIVEVMGKIQAGAVDADEAYTELEEMGVYRLDTEEESVMPLSSPADVVINRVAIVYDAAQAQWVVSGGGYWVNDAAWKAEKILRGYDGIGVKLYNTSGTYNTRVLYSSVYYSDGGSNERRHNNPSVSDGRQGVFFQYEDAKITGGLFGSNDTYLGKHFSATSVYDNNFSNFHGYARTQYTHTWSNSVINSISIGVDSFGIGVTDVSNSFTCFSSGETHF